MDSFPLPKEGSVFYEDSQSYACLAFAPKVEGHTVVAWRSDVEDINLLSVSEYGHLMEVVYKVRKALLEAYQTDKVYLVYLDEVRHVHWHLLPRPAEGPMGFELTTKPSGELTDLSKVYELQSLLK